MMNKFLIYGLSGGAALILAMAVIKRKPSRTMVKTLPGPKTYTVSVSDLPGAVAARFGTTPSALMATNGKDVWTTFKPGKVLNLPPNVKDSGPSDKAKGTTA